VDRAILYIPPRNKVRGPNRSVALLIHRVAQPDGRVLDVMYL
jgi:hypothetical protein